MNKYTIIFLILIALLHSKKIEYTKELIDREQGKIIEDILYLEGGYQKSGVYSGGGETMYGISKTIARKFGYKGLMRYLSKSKAKSIYKKGYWDVLKLEKVLIIGGDIGVDAYFVSRKLFDIGVNMGNTRAVLFFQYSLNSLNVEDKYFKPLEEDGIMGEDTLNAFRRLLEENAEFAERLPTMMTCLQGAYYIKLANTREADKIYINGWFKKRIEIKKD